MKSETIQTASTLTVTSVNLLEIIEVIGEAAALQLVERFGGTTVRLPALKNITAEHSLSHCLGIGVLIVLVKAIGGGRWLYIPQCKRGLIAQRNREIVERYSAGEKVDALALRYRISDRHIWNILGSTVVDDRQQGLF